ncbi:MULTISPECIES: TetR/AcrR family transcriptional regulator [Enterococcus]|mgnify:CR=1 FL=1|jgi:AcrR family transcriptional regulator|uniref:TetR/AcrR family transcriptional regulator n=1 Tax=Enterococcus TaxID=1350 RepID=UPI0018A110EA|nr:TetR/AcrR family transcriptional regulator [Enterococcus dispar]WCG34108.1 TetR/AcrR family transcriptional regulator [Enterococcus dispar]
MPKETFFHLTKEKQQRIMKAAKKEFSRVPLGDASIAQIIKDAGIPRGSFYQYFEDKEDLYYYYFQSMRRDSQQELNNAMKEAQGQLFDGFEIYFTKMVKEVLHGENAAFYKNLFMNMDYRSFHKVAPHFGKQSPPPFHAADARQEHRESMQAFYNMIDLTTLKVQNQKELKILVKMLMHVVFSTVAEGYRHLIGQDDFDMQEALYDFSMKLNWLKSGATKTKDEKFNR